MSPKGAKRPNRNPKSSTFNRHGESPGGAKRPDRNATSAEVALALARAGVYRLLGGAFAYPAEAGLEELGRLAVAAADGPLGAPPLTGPLLALGKAARESDAGELAQEHVFLFDRQVRCPPYEGAYGDAPQLAGKAAQLADVAGFYAAFGLEPAATRPDSEDHIAAELEFMSALALKEAFLLAEAAAEGIEVTREAQVKFLSDHLGRWAQALADALGEATALPYYAAAGDLLAAWVEAEVSRLGASPLRVQTRLGPDPLQEDGFACPMAAGEAPMEEGPRRA